MSLDDREIRAFSGDGVSLRGLGANVVMCDEKYADKHVEEAWRKDPQSVVPILFERMEKEEQRIRDEKDAMAALITKIKQQLATYEEETRPLCDSCGGDHHQSENYTENTLLGRYTSTWTRNDWKEFQLFRMKMLTDAVLSTEPHRALPLRGSRDIITFPKMSDRGGEEEERVDKDTAMAEVD